MSGIGSKKSTTSPATGPIPDQSPKGLRYSSYRGSVFPTIFPIIGISFALSAHPFSGSGGRNGEKDNPSPGFSDMEGVGTPVPEDLDRKSTRLNSSHV